LLKVCEAQENYEASKFSRQLSGEPWAASFLGRLFEREILNYLDRNDTDRDLDLSIRRLTNSNEMTWTYPRGIVRFRFEKLTITDDMESAVENKTPMHLVPEASNFPAVDSIVYNPNDPDAVVTCIKITMNKDHTILVKGLRSIQRWLRPLGLHPTKKRPWRLLFIVPLDMASTFKAQNFKGDTAKGEWRSKVNQYVLGLEEQTIFKRRSNSSAQRAITSQQGEQQVRC
jgi:hypothetical protein